MLILLAIALMLLCGELTRQFVLLHFICIIVVIRFTGFLLSHTLRRQLNAIGCQLAAGWHTHAVRTRQLRTNPLFYLRTWCSTCRQAKDRRRSRSGCCGLFHTLCHWCNRRRWSNRRCGDRRCIYNRLLHRLGNRLIPCCQLLALTGTALFNLFEIVHWRTRRFDLFHHLRFWLRRDVRLSRRNRLRDILLIRLRDGLLVVRVPLRLMNGLRLIRLLPRFLLDRRIAFWLWCDNRLWRMHARRRLPLYLRLLNSGLGSGNRRRRHNGFRWCCISLRRRGRGCRGGNRCGNRMTV